MYVCIQMCPITSRRRPLFTNRPRCRLSLPLLLLCRRAMLIPLKTWTGRAATSVVSLLTLSVFFCLDFIDAILCVFYRFLDAFIEGEASPCYCDRNTGNERSNPVCVEEDGESEASETLYGRRNIFREMGVLKFAKKWESFGLEINKKRGCEKGDGERVAVDRSNRWSECGCDSCVSWMWSGEMKLHIVVREPSRSHVTLQVKRAPENVIFVHGFLSSSLFWTETVFPNLSESSKANYRFFAPDLLGFGKSPKPRDCSYTLRDHLGMIEKSVISPYRLNSFHLVAHSMGCVIALALAARYPECVKSITLIAPPYFPSLKSNASLKALQKLAEKKLWPPILFGSSFMSWYEHLGRCICFLVCRNHRIWESIMKLLNRKRDLHFTAVDLTRHTHHSAWHTMHNVICGGAKLMDDYLETISKSRVRISIIHGDKDQVVPLECSNNIKAKVPNAEVDVIPNADHTSMILRGEQAFARTLERIWGRHATPGKESEEGWALGR